MSNPSPGCRELVSYPYCMLKGIYEMKKKAWKETSYLKELWHVYNYNEYITLHIDILGKQ